MSKKVGKNQTFAIIVIPPGMEPGSGGDTDSHHSAESDDQRSHCHIRAISG